MLTLHTEDLIIRQEFAQTDVIVKNNEFHVCLTIGRGGKIFLSLVTGDEKYGKEVFRMYVTQKTLRELPEL